MTFFLFVLNPGVSRVLDNVEQYRNSKEDNRKQWSYSFTAINFPQPRIWLQGLSTKDEPCDSFSQSWRVENITQATALVFLWPVKLELPQNKTKPFSLGFCSWWDNQIPRRNSDQSSAHQTKQHFRWCLFSGTSIWRWSRFICHLTHLGKINK